ncbi:MAG: hypothetical protein WBE44_17395 [Terriglobales bacterium]
MAATALMINVDLSKAFHPRIVDALSAFLPGLFFEVTLLLANPQPVRSSAARAGLGGYAQLFVALLGAYVLGCAFMSWVQLLRVMLIKLRFFCVGRWAQLVKSQLIARRRHAIAGQPIPRQPWPVGFLTREDRRLSDRDREQEYYRRAWGQAARVLLKRYGIEAPRGPDPGEWHPWVRFWGGLRWHLLRSYLIMMSLEAAGWSGLAALYFAPPLRNAPFVGLCGFLIFFGLLNDYNLARYQTDPIDVWMVSLGNILKDLKEAGAAIPNAAAQPDAHAPEDPAIPED